MSTATLTAPSALESPREQLQRLCDPGSFRPLRSAVASPRLGERAAPGDGV
jgi:hypothetical protein